MAGGWQDGERIARPSDPAAIIEAARRRQDELATETLRVWWKTRGKPEVAVLLTRRGIVHDLEGTLFDHAHVRIAECDAARDAIRAGLAQIGVDTILQDEKSVPAMAAERLGCSVAECDAELKSLRPAEARHWTKEERTVAFAAWLHSQR